MANQAIIAAKAARVDEVEKKISAAQSVVLVDYRGYTVEQDTELRANFRKAGVEYAVIKNGILQRAAEKAGIDASVNEFFKGPTAVAFGVNDAVAPAKIIKDFIKKTKKGAIKGGIIDGKIQNTAAIEALAELPPREVLIARIFGSMNAPVTKLAVALNAIKEKMESGETAAE
ncbi:MAG: 50S ribosomal protein L10 [Christensenellales bacterium]|jgi:large subunit ribosomal protein L10